MSSLIFCSDKRLQMPSSIKTAIFPQNAPPPRTAPRAAPSPHMGGPDVKVAPNTTAGADAAAPSRPVTESTAAKSTRIDHEARAHLRPDHEHSNLADSLSEPISNPRTSIGKTVLNGAAAVAKAPGNYLADRSAIQAHAAQAAGVHPLLANVTGRQGATYGALAGAALGALNPGRDDDGDENSMVGGMLRGGAKGMMVGGLAGHLGKGVVKDMKAPHIAEATAKVKDLRAAGKSTAVAPAQIETSVETPAINDPEHALNQGTAAAPTQLPFLQKRPVQPSGFPAGGYNTGFPGMTRVAHVKLHFPKFMKTAAPASVPVPQAAVKVPTIKSPMKTSAFKIPKPFSMR